MEHAGPGGKGAFSLCKINNVNPITMRPPQLPAHILKFKPDFSDMQKKNGNSGQIRSDDDPGDVRRRPPNPNRKMPRRILTRQRLNPTPVPADRGRDSPGNRLIFPKLPVKRLRAIIYCG